MVAAGKGRALIQGQLAINFISEGYLYVVLKNYQKAQTASPLDANSQQANLIQALSQKTNLLTQLANLKNPTAQQAATMQVQLARINNQIVQLSGQVGPAGLAEAKFQLSNADQLTVPGPVFAKTQKPLRARVPEAESSPLLRTQSSRALQTPATDSDRDLVSF